MNSDTANFVNVSFNRCFSYFTNVFLCFKYTDTSIRAAYYYFTILLFFFRKPLFPTYSLFLPSIWLIGNIRFSRFNQRTGIEVYKLCFHNYLIANEKKGEKDALDQKKIKKNYRVYSHKLQN